MATNIGRLEFLVNADGRLMERDLRRIGRTAGAAGGNEASKSFDKSFNTGLRNALGRSQGMFDGWSKRVGGSISRLRTNIAALSTGLDKSSSRADRFGTIISRAMRTAWRGTNEFELRLGAMNWALDYSARKAKESEDAMNGLGDATDRNGRLLKSHVGRTIAAWTMLVLAIGEGTATLSSGVGASLTAMLSSVSLAVAAAGSAALIGIGGLIAALPAAVSMFAAFKDAGLDVGAELGAAFDEVGAALADRLLPNMNAFLDAVRGIAGSNAYLEGTAKVLGGLMDGLTKGLNSPGLALFIEAMAGPIGDGFVKLGDAIGSVIDGLGAFAAAGGEFFNTLMGDLASWASDWAEKMNLRATTGGFDEFFETARESIESVLGLLNAFGDAIGTVFMAGADTGNSMLNTLSELLGKWNEWMNTVEGQAVLEEWFANGERIFNGLLNLAGALGQALGSLVTPESVDRLLGFMDALANAMPLVGGILSLFGRLDILTIFAEALNTVGALLTPLLPPLFELAEVIGKVIVDALVGLQEPFAKVAEAVRPIIDVLTILVEAVFPVVFDVIGTAIEYLADIVTAFGGAEAGTKEYEDAMKVFGDVVKTVMNIVGGIVKSVMDFVAGIFKTVGALLRGDFSGAWKAMYGIVEDVLGNFGVDIKDVERTIRNWWRDLGGWIDDIIGWFEDLWDGVEDALSNIGDWFDDVFGGIGDWFNSLGGWISDALGWLGSLTGAANTAQGAANSAANAGRGLGGSGRTEGRFASGGILNGPRRILAGESGPEAIVPLRRNLNHVDPSVRWLSALAQNRTPAFAGGGMVGGGKTLNVEQGAIVVQEAGNGPRAANDVMNRLAEYVYS